MNVLPVLISLLAVILAGVGAGKLGLFNEAARKALSGYVYYIATSALIIQAIAGIKLAELEKLPRFIAANTVLYVVLIIGLYAALRLAKLPYKAGGSLLLTAVAANTVYLGLPIIKPLYGAEGVLYIIIIFTIPSAIMYIAAFYLLGKWRSGRVSLITVLKDFLLNPYVMSVCIGLLLLVLGIHLPTPITKALDMLGSTTIGVALFTLGLFLAAASWKHIRPSRVMLATVLKLIIVPLIAWLVSRLFGLTGPALAATVIAAAMPSAVYCMIAATQYGFDEQATADTIMVSTLLFIPTSLIWISLVH